MSQKNKPAIKSCRRDARAVRILAVRILAGRTPVSQPVPAAIATKILTNPKYKVSSKIRRKLSLRRDVVVEIPRQEPKHPAVKLALHLQRLSLATLLRRRNQAARKAATCKNLIAELSPGSQFAEGIQAEQTNQLGILKQVQAEILSRK